MAIRPTAVCVRSTPLLHQAPRAGSRLPAGVCQRVCRTPCHGVCSRNPTRQKGQQKDGAVTQGAALQGRKQGERWGVGGRRQRRAAGVGAQGPHDRRLCRDHAAGLQEAAHCRVSGAKEWRMLDGSPRSILRGVPWQCWRAADAACCTRRHLVEGREDSGEGGKGD